MNPPVTPPITHHTLVPWTQAGSTPRVSPTESPYIGARDLFTMPTNKLHKLILKFLIIIPKNIPHLELIFLKFQKNLNI